MPAPHQCCPCCCVLCQQGSEHLTYLLPKCAQQPDCLRARYGLLSTCGRSGPGSGFENSKRHIIRWWHVYVPTQGYIGKQPCANLLELSWISFRDSLVHLDIQARCLRVRSLADCFVQFCQLCTIAWLVVLMMWLVQQTCRYITTVSMGRELGRKGDNLLAPLAVLPSTARGFRTA